MFKLIKYDLRRHFLTFGVCIGFNLALLSMSISGVGSEKAVRMLDSTLGIINLVLIIYSCKELHKDFCSDENILGLTIPVDMIKRFLVKYSMFITLYFGYLLSRIPIEIINSRSNYNILKLITTNHGEYILHDLLGGIFFFASTVAAVTFALVVANSLTKNKSAVMLLSISVISLFFVISTRINQKMRSDAFNPFSNLTYRNVTIDEAVGFELKISYHPFGFSRSGVSFSPMWTGVSKPGRRGFLGDTLYSIQFCLPYIIISLLGSSALIKRKGINA